MCHTATLSIFQAWWRRWVRKGSKKFCKTVCAPLPDSFSCLLIVANVCRLGSRPTGVQSSKCRTREKGSSTAAALLLWRFNRVGGEALRERAPTKEMLKSASFSNTHPHTYFRVRGRRSVALQRATRAPHEHSPPDRAKFSLPSRGSWLKVWGGGFPLPPSRLLRLSLSEERDPHRRGGSRRAAAGCFSSGRTASPRGDSTPAPPPVAALSVAAAACLALPLLLGSLAAE